MFEVQGVRRSVRLSNLQPDVGFEGLKLRVQGL